MHMKSPEYTFFDTKISTVYLAVYNTTYVVLHLVSMFSIRVYVLNEFSKSMKRFSEI